MNVIESFVVVLWHEVYSQIIIQELREHSYVCYAWKIMLNKIVFLKRRLGFKKLCRSATTGNFLLAPIRFSVPLAFL